MTYTITITDEQLDLMTTYLQSEKINTNEFERSVTEDTLLEAWRTSLAQAVPTGN
jgi:hypothetical protein